MSIGGLHKILRTTFVLACTTQLSCDAFRENRALENRSDILVISDSNGVGNSAWPSLLRHEIETRSSETGLRIHNASRDGRTLTIDRGGIETTAYLGVSKWIEAARRESDGSLEAVFLCLGTNDLQKQFLEDFNDEARTELRIDQTIQAIRRDAPEAKLVISTPPSMCDIEQHLEEGSQPVGKRIDARWEGAQQRRRLFTDLLKRKALEYSALFLDTSRNSLEEACRSVQKDGIHLNESGHREMAVAAATTITNALNIAE